MKIKTLFALLTILLITFIIYIINMDRKIYILSLGNSNIYEIPSYIDKLSINLKEKKLLEENINITNNLNQILENIKLNKKIQGKNMKNHLIKADIIIVTVTSNKENLNELISIIKDYSKETIVIIGELTNDNIKMSKKYEIELINIDLKQNQNEMIYANLINVIEENI